VSRVSSRRPSPATARPSSRKRPPGTGRPSAAATPQPPPDSSTPSCLSGTARSWACSPSTPAIGQFGTTSPTNDELALFTPRRRHDYDARNRRLDGREKLIGLLRPGDAGQVGRLSTGAPSRPRRCRRRRSVPPAHTRMPQNRRRWRHPLQPRDRSPRAAHSNFKRGLAGPTCPEVSISQVWDGPPKPRNSLNIHRISDVLL
jgi:hypothetical protein